MNMEVTLRKTTIEDLENVLNAENHPDNSCYVYQWSYDEHKTSLQNLNILHYIICNDNNEFYGYIILDNVQDISRSVNLRRIVITKKGIGIGRSVLQKIQKIAFEELKIHRLWLDVFVDNNRAYELYKNVGFRLEGTLIDSYFRNNAYVSQHIMAKLHSEYNG
ncbi:MAG: GNAT family protein [Burkholderiales bacterium]|nr:GNAT family protein [Burkholderiales bacterium]